MDGLEERPCLMAPPGEKEEEKEAAAMLREFWRKGAEQCPCTLARTRRQQHFHNLSAPFSPRHIDYARGA
jgi:hypothetical protein